MEGVTGVPSMPMFLARFAQAIKRLQITFRAARMYFTLKAKEQHVRMLRLLYSIKLRAVIGVPHGMRRFVSSFSVRLWSDTKGFDRILELLSEARFSIVIQMFIWKDDETGKAMASTLLDAAKRGVRVRIIKEAIGDVFETEGDFLGTKTNSDPLWHAFWTHPNIVITHEAQQNHSKVYIIDGAILLLTGMNIGDEYRWEWHDYVVEMRGARIVDQYLGALSGSPLPGITLVSNTPTVKMLRPCVMELLQSAKRSIIVEQAYLTDVAVLDLLIKKSKEHVDVVVILPESPDIQANANLESADRLLREGVKKYMKVFLSPTMIHGKIILVDRKQALIGSLNLIPSSLDQMGEVSVLLGGAFTRVLVKLNTILLKDMVKSKLVSGPLSFSLVRKILAWFYL